MLDLRVPYRVLRQIPLERFGKTLPPFTYRGELQYPDSEREDAAYAYVKKDEEPIRSLHRAMNSKVQQGADFLSGGLHLSKQVTRQRHGESVTGQTLPSSSKQHIRSRPLCQKATIGHCIFICSEGPGTD